MSVIDMESTVTRTRLRYTRYYLTPSICSLIKPAAMEKFMPFPAKIHTVMLSYTIITDHFVLCISGLKINIQRVKIGGILSRIIYSCNITNQQRNRITVIYEIYLLISMQYTPWNMFILCFTTISLAFKSSLAWSCSSNIKLGTPFTNKD